MDRLKGRNPEEIDFLRKVDPGNYIALLRYSKGIPNDEILCQCYEQIPSRSRPFAIWVLARLNKWDIIEQDVKAFIQEPLTTFPGFSDQQFEKYS